MFWNTLMGVNSFIILPATGIFIVYAVGDGILHGHWIQAGVATLIFGVGIIAQVLLALMDDA